MVSHTGANSETVGVLTRQKTSQLLKPTLLSPFIKVEEECHPWSVNGAQKLDHPLLRIWDCYSGSQPDQDSRMLSRAPDMPLDTKEARMVSLATHLNHKNWTPTPYISCTSSADRLVTLARKRDKGNRGKQTLTVIDPSSRAKNGLPTLDVATEMQHYSISDPYNQGNQYYIDHYICLWEVTPDEVVGHWQWDDLAASDNWYDNVIMPEFDLFRKGKSLGSASPIALASAPAAATVSTFDMSALKETLPGQSSIDVT